METEKTPSNGKQKIDETDDPDPIELVLFQVSECYVYIVISRPLLFLSLLDVNPVSICFNSSILNFGEIISGIKFKMHSWIMHILFDGSYICWVFDLSVSF